MKKTSKDETVKQSKPRAGGKKKQSGEAPQETIGLDLGDKTSCFCRLNAEGEVMEEGTLQNTVGCYARHFAGVARLRIAMETGTQSGWISRQLEGYGHQVLVAHARDLHGITRSDKKNDRNDAEKLARYARLDPQLLNPIRHRSAQQQSDLSAIRGRDALVRARTLLVNNARGLAKTEGLRLPPAITVTFGARSLEALPAGLQSALKPVLAAIDQLSVQIEVCESVLEQIASERYAVETKLLRSVPGVGLLTSLTYVVTLSDAQRFAHSRDVGAYLGLRPKQRQSGERDPQLGINKAGNGYLRKLLVQCAQHILGRWGKPSRLREWGLALAGSGSGNNKKKAIVAVARKLSVLLHRLWVSRSVYQPYFGQPADDGCALVVCGAEVCAG